MSIYDALEEMRHWLPREDWVGLEAAFHARCQGVAPDAATRIASLALSRYEADLRTALGQIERHRAAETKAVYWEFDPDNGWASAFFPCRTYRPESLHDDEWATDFADDDVVAGPGAADLGAEFAPDWDRDAASSARNLYLIARTIAAFGRASAGWPATIPLCAGYHDQDVVYRVRGT